MTKNINPKANIQVRENQLFREVIFHSACDPTKPVSKTSKAMREKSAGCPASA